MRVRILAQYEIRRNTLLSVAVVEQKIVRAVCMDAIDRGRIEPALSQVVRFDLISV